MQMEALLERLKALTPAIKEICKVSGTPGVSIGVLHRGKVIYTANFGYRNVAKKLPPDEGTLYYIASLSKAFTTAAVGILVDQGKVEWDTPVSNILPDFKHPDSTIREKASLVDFLSHRTGLASKNQMWWTEFGHLSLPREETVHFSSYLETVYPFQKRWLYNNWGYGLADCIIEKLTTVTWGEFLAENIFRPIGMTNTTVQHVPESRNFAEGYMSLSDGTPYHVPRPEIEDGKILEGASAIQSNVRELLRFYKHLMKAADDQKAGRDCSSPLKDIAKLFQAQVNLEAQPSPRERSYALGWVRTVLPGSLGVVGLNPTYRKHMPIVGKGLEEPRLCLYHQGSLLSFLSSVHLLPDSQSAVVVLTNSMANNDAADWLGEMLLEAVLNNSEKNNYSKIAKESAQESVAQWPRMEEWLENRKVPGTKPRPFHLYVGVYWNVIQDWSIEIFLKDNSLRMCFQGIRKRSYDLTHYHYDTFSWLLTRDEDVIHYGRFPMTWSPFYLISFKFGEETGDIRQLIWKHDPDVPEGETFYRDPKSNTAQYRSEL
jgi:CubicO group peptidase (beta-lactamase class C family)